MKKKTNNYIQGKDIYSRMNYLYQASELMINVNPAVSSIYTNLMVNISRKATLRFDQSIKRNICKHCHSLLVPGKTSKVKKMKKPDPFMKITCKICNESKQFNCSKESVTWTQDPDCCMEIIDFNES